MIYHKQCSLLLLPYIPNERKMSLHGFHSMEKIILKNRPMIVLFISSECVSNLRRTKCYSFTSEMCSSSSNLSSIVLFIFFFSLKKLKLGWCKCDELDTLINGLSYLGQLNPKECFFYEEPQNDENSTKHCFTLDNQRPFLLVNIGSGISILHVESETRYRRITGTRSVEYENFNSNHCARS